MNKKFTKVIHSMKNHGVTRPKIVVIAQFPINALSGEFSGRGGGQAATWLPQLAKSWDSQETFEIHWVIFDYKQNHAEMIEQWGQFFHRIPCPSITVSMIAARWPQRLACRKLFRSIRPDLIHCWGTENLNGSALLEFNGSSILSMQGIINTCIKTGDLRGWRWQLFCRWEPTSIRKASVVTSESKWGMNQVASIVPGKFLRQVEYGVNPSYYQVSWHPDATKPRIIFVGSLTRLKGVDILLEMLKRHPQRPWKMIFAGDGYLADALRNLKDSNVEVLGMIKSDQVQAEMSNAWALVMPSRADTSPNVVKEARVIGLPIVASPHGGHAEHVNDSKDGFIVPSEDPDAWFQALNQLASNFNLCHSMGTARHAYFREYFRPEKTAEAFLELYREMLD
jgi:glycosyltransferase involved in cell wall biosynthesis